MILVHEWGHYAAARMCGIRVEVFSIGFGPRIWGWKRGATDYRVSILPLGGYVKMAGDNPMEEREQAPDEFLSKPRWQRAIVAVAGPVMNVVLTFVVVLGSLWMVGEPYDAYLDKPVEIVVFPQGSAGEAAGLRPGDRIVELNEMPVTSWESLAKAYARLDAGEVLRIKADRAGTEVTAKLQKPSRPEDLVGVFGHVPYEPVIGQVFRGMPASQVGLKVNDRLLEVNGQPLAYWGQLTDVIHHSIGKPLTFRVKRGESEETIIVTPIQGQTRGRTVGQIGILPKSDTAFRKVDFAYSIQRASAFVVNGTGQILEMLGALFQGKVSIKMLGGPVEIAVQSGAAAREGMQEFVYLMAVISLNLAILNLLPIPILDGGHLLMLAVEGTMRRDLSLAVKERVLQVGMVFLLVIFVIVMYNDVLKQFPGR